MKYFCSFHEKVVGITRLKHRNNDNILKSSLANSSMFKHSFKEITYITQAVQMSTSSTELFSH